MAEFLHQVVKKREREMEMRGLLDFDSWTRSTPMAARQLGFSLPRISMPSANEITYRSWTHDGVTEHSVVFPNVGSWIQSTVIVTTSESTILRLFSTFKITAWKLLAGHPCRPNFHYTDGNYTCETCYSIYSTDGSELEDA